MYCGSCGARIEEGLNFCTECGEKASKGNKPVHSDSTPSRRGEPARSGHKYRRFSCSPDRFPSLVSSLEDWLRGQDFELQNMPTENGGVLLQVAKKGGWRKFVGMGTALNIVLNLSGNALSVEIGAGKWLDKAVSGAAGMFLLWPLAITAGLGAWQQIRIPDRIFEFIRSKV